MATHELGYSLQIQAKKGFKEMIFSLIRSVLFLSEKQEIVQGYDSMENLVEENSSFNVVYLRIGTLGLCPTHVPRPTAGSRFS